METSLCTAAATAARAAHAPYSKYRVGAAVVTSDGQVFSGCNVENASSGLTICAERVAVTTAVAAGQREIAAIAVATRDAASPCGACRQVLAEFADDGLPILLCDLDGGLIRRTTLGTLLPDRFRWKPTPDG